EKADHLGGVIGFPVRKSLAGYCPGVAGVVGAAPAPSWASRAALSPASCVGSSLDAPGVPACPPCRAVPLSSAVSWAAVSAFSWVASSLDLGVPAAAAAAGGVEAALAAIVLAL